MSPIKREAQHAAFMMPRRLGAEADREKKRKEEKKERRKSKFSRDSARRASKAVRKSIVGALMPSSAAAAVGNIARRMSLSPSKGPPSPEPVVV